MDFSQLRCIANLAILVMGLASKSNSQSRAFFKDILCITIDGPSRPQLTLVDIPFLIVTSTEDVSDKNVEMVAEIMDHYIKIGVRYV